MPQSQRKPSGSPAAWLARSKRQLQSRPAMQATSPTDCEAQAGASAEAVLPATSTTAAKPTLPLQLASTSAPHQQPRGRRACDGSG